MLFKPREELDLVVSGVRWASTSVRVQGESSEAGQTHRPDWMAVRRRSMHSLPARQREG